MVENMLPAAGFGLKLGLISSLRGPFFHEAREGEQGCKTSKEAWLPILQPALLVPCGSSVLLLVIARTSYLHNTGPRLRRCALNSEGVLHIWRAVRPAFHAYRGGVRKQRHPFWKFDVSILGSIVGGSNLENPIF